MEQLEIHITGKDPIRATLWTAASPKAFVLIQPATGVPQDFYRSFAEYLHGLGFHVLTYDYRGIGRSCLKDIRQYDVSMSDWMLEDTVYVTDWVRERFTQLPLLAVGHSVGGHAIALSSATQALRAGVMIASHAGITALIQAPMERLRVGMVMRVLAPILCRLCGYMPARRLGLGENLPRSVMQQWSRWTRLANYFYDDPLLGARERAGQVRIPLLVLGFDDDPWANPQAISQLLGPIKNAPIERLHIQHKNVGVPGIGHMGFFRKRNAQALWPIVGDWLLKHSQSRPAAHP